MRSALLALLFFVGSLTWLPAFEASKGSAVLAKAILASGEERTKLLDEFGLEADYTDSVLVETWRRGEVWIATMGDGSSEVVLYNGQTGSGNTSAVRMSDGKTITFDLAKASASNPDRASRKLLVKLNNVLALKHPNDRNRAEAAREIGMQQDEEGLKMLEELLPKQTSKKAREGFEEGIALAQLGLTTGAEQVAAIAKLGELESLKARDQITALLEAENAKPSEEQDAALIKAATVALGKIGARQQLVEGVSTLFRGLSLGSVLLVVALGLAITFGLMGVINMAHGEFITIGGYTCFIVQTWFINHYGGSGSGFDNYFLVSLPLCFLAAAFVGWLIEWSIVRHLYHRPLESLLATWGLSMILQQAFRLKFGAANVQVSSPSWLAGNYDLMGVTLGWNRLFVIGFALAILCSTLLVMAKTSIGLQLRAVMQNRRMAASLGIRTGRMNGFTFAFGSGLAGLAGAFLSQLGNVGPSMGQSYIVDSFMIVTVGGVGNLIGAALSALGIGTVDQLLQPLLGPVMGKITTLLAIILLLQWRPGGLFPSRSRSLDG
jgi:urea transport system permease protein